MRKLLLGVLLLVSTSCAKIHAPELVVITAVACEPKVGMDDCVTVVQTSNKAVFRAPGTYGAVGDTILVQRVYPFDGSAYFISPQY